MGRLLRVRLILAAIGAVIFFIGTRNESQRVRWVGIGFVAAAWLSRFLRAALPRKDDQDPSI